MTFNTPSGIRSLDFFNNTAINSSLTFAANTDSIWHVKDNLLDHCTVTASPVNEGGVLSGNNANRQGSISAGFSSAALSVDIEYATGPFGDRYIDPLYSGLSSLVNAGSRLAFEAGLSAYTILPDDSQDVDTVDIGHHYHVEDLSGGTFWTDPSPLAEQLAREIMAGTGVTVVPGSASYTGANVASGFFGNGSDADLPVEVQEGVVLCSGDIGLAHGPNESNDGWLLGDHYTSPDGATWTRVNNMFLQLAISATPIPEPSALALAGLACLGLIANSLNRRLSGGG